MERLDATIHLAFAFDIGYEIDMELALTLLPGESGPLARRRRTPESIRYRPAPLRAAIEPEGISLPAPAEVIQPPRAELSVFDFGAISLVVQFPVQMTMGAILELAGELADSTPLNAAARNIVLPWIERLRPIGVGWHSVVGSFNSPGIDFTLKPSAERWEGGSCNMPGLQALGTSLGLLVEIGKEAVSRRILERAEAVRELARSAGWSVHGSALPGDVSGIVALKREGTDPEGVARRLRTEGIAVACRRGLLRISPHIYNNDDDLQRLRNSLAAAPGRVSS